MPPPDAATVVSSRFAAALAFIAGYVDTCVFVALFGLFTAHVTGNFVLMGAALVHRNADVLLKLLAFPAFVVAVILAVIVRRKVGGGLAWLLAAEGALLAAAAATMGLSEAARPDELHAILAAILAASAMGLQNAAMRLELATLSSTTVMTINVTQAAIDATTYALEPLGPRRDEARARLGRMLPMIVTFTAGAACGAAAYLMVHLAALVVPALLCAVLAFRIR